MNKHVDMYYIWKNTHVDMNYKMDEQTCRHEL